MKSEVRDSSTFQHVGEQAARIDPKNPVRESARSARAPWHPNPHIHVPTHNNVEPLCRISLYFLVLLNQTYWIVSLLTILLNCAMLIVIDMLGAG